MDEFDGEFPANRGSKPKHAKSNPFRSLLPKIRHVLETIRPGTIFFWDGDGAMSHDDQMRSLRLMGSDVIRLCNIEYNVQQDWQNSATPIGTRLAGAVRGGGERQRGS